MLVRIGASSDPAAPDLMLELPPGATAVHIPDGEPLTVESFQGLGFICRDPLDTELHGQPTSANGKKSHAASSR